MPFWNKADEDIKQLAIKELEKIGLASSANVLDATVLRMEKTYPAYFGTYERFDTLKNFTDQHQNLFLVGRNGMHKYNNSDHSMLTAMVAVDNIQADITSKENIWSINTEQEYHEEKGVDNAAEAERSAPGKAKGIGAFLEGTLANYICKNPAHTWMVRFGIVALILQFVLFKFLYPFASFINGDSYVYLETAYHNYDINTYPIGYSMFLRLFSVFTKSDTALVAFQYGLLQLSVLSFMFTLFYFYQPKRITKQILFWFMVLNPIFLYLANYVSSDAFFLSLSLIWFTQLLWINHRPTVKLVIFNAIMLFLAFSVRYNALYYPVIGLVSVFLTRKNWPLKLSGFALGIVMILIFIGHTSNKYDEKQASVNLRLFQAGNWLITPCMPTDMWTVHRESPFPNGSRLWTKR